MNPEFVLIGDPVAHSLSPVMHNALYQELGKVKWPFSRWHYSAVRCANEEEAAYQIDLVRTGRYRGMNVTMPYKTYICKYLDGLSPAARLMGAVNTVEIKDGKSYGHNTDGAGFSENLRGNGFNPSGKKVTIVGAGGAGSAVSTQLALDGVASISIFNIKDEFWEKTAGRINRLAEETGVGVSLEDLNDRASLASSIADSDLFVNATRVGAGDLIDQCVIDEDMLHEGLTVADTVYNPVDSKLIKMAKAHGLAAYGGLGMLLQQAALAEKIWFGTDMPIELIREKLFS